jgi:hypothetical protein
MYFKNAPRDVYFHLTMTSLTAARLCANLFLISRSFFLGGPSGGKPSCHFCARGLHAQKMHDELPQQQQRGLC